MLVMATPLAALSAIASDLPRWLAVSLAALALIHGARLIRIEWLKPKRSVVIGQAVEIDGVGVDGFTVRWRGPLAFAHWVDGRGRSRRLAWWPDTLPSAARRELRMAAPSFAAARVADSVAT